MGSVVEMHRGRPRPYDQEVEKVQQPIDEWLRWAGLTDWQWSVIVIALEQHHTQGARMLAVDLRKMFQADSRAKHPSNQAPRGGAS